MVVISPEPAYNWIPSNIWVGVGLMKKEQVLLPLAPIYKRHEIEFKQARAVALYPEGDQTSPRPSVEKLNGPWKAEQGNVRRLPMTF